MSTGSLASSGQRGRVPRTRLVNSSMKSRLPNMGHQPFPGPLVIPFADGLFDIAAVLPGAVLGPGHGRHGRSGAVHCRAPSSDTTDWGGLHARAWPWGKGGALRAPPSSQMSIV